jgi:hypothetical protein
MMSAGFHWRRRSVNVPNLDRPRAPISPDRRMVAAHQWGNTPASPSILSVVSAEGGTILQALPSPAGIEVFGWSGDGRFWTTHRRVEAWATSGSRR